MSRKLRLPDGAKLVHIGEARGLALVLLIMSILAVSFSARTTYAQGATLKDSSKIGTRNMALGWLGVMKDAVKEVYYDPKYHGIDLNARFDAARETIESLDYDWQMFQVMAQIMMEFDDAHTSLILPPRKATKLPRLTEEDWVTVDTIRQFLAGVAAANTPPNQGLLKQELKARGRRGFRICGRQMTCPMISLPARVMFNECDIKIMFNGGCIA